ncbi:NAD(P)H-binding protein [Pararhizobium sp.]|uniref:NAD(P)H-binding protein n=1 Tax=Pararhizobium sp. TaxID=1977563 RepID=UPI0027271C2F|nr:NAD(P)H-binding protein [Pararhizobium sp.]MDO9414548.1 NAD(P)H-binding protein [Pararhizobium sp.]
MTSSPPAMSLQASPLPASLPAATAATTAAAATVQPVAAGARVAVVAGATGLVGREILARLLADNTWQTVHCVGRSAPAVVHPKLVVHLAPDLSSFVPPPVDDVFIALGTTIKVAGSQQAFRAVDFDAVLAVARAGRSAGAQRLGIVSAMGADSRSSVFYNRVKGDMENAVSALGYDAVVLARPSLLSGDRSTLAQPKRSAEKFAAAAMRLLRPVTPANYRAIAAADVAQALINTFKNSPAGHHVLLSGDMQSPS